MAVDPRLGQVRFLPIACLLLGAVFIGVPEAAQAITITGEVGFVGGFTPIDSAGNAVDLGDATGIDLGGAIAVGATGDLAGSIGFLTPAAFSDFQFFPNLDPVPVNPLWSAGTFQFLLSSVVLLVQSDQFLSLEGAGIMSGVGFEDTAYGWSFSGDGNGGTFSFSSTNGPVSMAEPSEVGSMMLFVLGVFCVSIWNRRRMGREAQVSFDQ